MEPVFLKIPGYLTIRNNFNLLNNFKYLITDFLGREVIDGIIYSGEFSIDISGINSGAYIIEFLQNERIIQKNKLIIQN